MGTPLAREYFASGFGDDEIADERTSVWSTAKSSTLALFTSPADTPHLLRVVAHAYFGAIPQIVGVSINGSALGSFSLGTRWQSASLVVPSRVIRRGRNRITFSYSRIASPRVHEKGSQDSRTLAVKYDEVDFYPMPRETRLEMGSPKSNYNTLQGWSSPEMENARKIRWSDGPLSRVIAFIHPEDAPYELEFSAAAYRELSPLNVDVIVNGVPLEQGLVLGSKWSKYAIELPEGSLRSGENHIEFQYERTRKPSDIDPESNDSRSLAVRYQTIEIAMVSNN
jgi:hypothetical protein